jgi:predicted restriction endonuclease
LSAIHDKAFDKGLIALTDDFRIVVSEQVKSQRDPFLDQILSSAEGREIAMPEKFAPDLSFIVKHRQTVFVDSLGG